MVVGAFATGAEHDSHVVEEYDEEEDARDAQAGVPPIVPILLHHRLGFLQGALNTV